MVPESDGGSAYVLRVKDFVSKHHAPRSQPGK
jgi:hypothetical protein